MPAGSNKPPWRANVERFDERVFSVGATTFEFLHDYIALLPRAPFDFQFSDRATIKYQLCLLVIGNLRSAREIAFSASKAWLQGHFLLASVGVRMLIELQGQLAWADENVRRLLENGDLESAFNRMKKLLLGTKSSIALIRGDRGPHPLVNVMDFVRAAQANSPDVMEDYEFLCDAAHPSYMMHSWLLFAGPSHDNWANTTFANEALLMLDRILSAGEKSLLGIERSAVQIMERCTPEVAAEAIERS